jgi:hypothetical protein
MRAIKEYIIDQKVVEPQTLYMVRGAEVVGLIDGDSNVKIVTVIDPTESISDLRTFKICTTTDTIYSDNITYVGNFLSAFGTKYVIEVHK